MSLVPGLIRRQAFEADSESSKLRLLGTDSDPNLARTAWISRGRPTTIAAILALFLATLQSLTAM